MAGWDTLENLIHEEQKQLIEEGVVASAAQAAAAEAAARRAAGKNEHEVWAAFTDLPRRADFGFDEPSDLDGIRALRNGRGRRTGLNLSDAQLLDKMHGAWLGRCAGCALGKPVEGMMGSHRGIPSWQRQKKYLTAISPGEWPLRDYIPRHSPAEAEVGKVWCPSSQREQIAFMESDDDIR